MSCLAQASGVRDPDFLGHRLDQDPGNEVTGGITHEEGVLPILPLSVSQGLGCVAQSPFCKDQSCTKMSGACDPRSGVVDEGEKYRKDKKKTAAFICEPVELNSD